MRHFESGFVEMNREFTKDFSRKTSV